MQQQVPKGRRDEKLCDRTSKDEEAYTHTGTHKGNFRELFQSTNSLLSTHEKNLHVTP